RARPRRRRGHQARRVRRGGPGLRRPARDSRKALRRSSAGLDDRVRAAACESPVLARGRGHRRGRALDMGAGVAITGAWGQLGRRTAELVLAQCEPRDVILATRTPAALADLGARGADVRYADFDDRPALLAAFAGAERLLLISATDLQRRVAQH